MQVDRIAQNKQRRLREDTKGRCHHDRILLQSMDAHRTHEWRNGRIDATEYFRQATAAGQFAAEIVRRQHSAL